jgi:hypothetical protein
MPDNVLFVAATLVVGFALGGLVAWRVLQRRLRGREELVCSLQTSLKGKEVSLLDLRARLQAQKADAEHVRDPLAHRDQVIRDLTSRIDQQNQVVGQLVVAYRPASHVSLGGLEDMLREATRRLLDEEKSCISKR